MELGHAQRTTDLHRRCGDVIQAGITLFPHDFALFVEKFGRPLQIAKGVADVHDGVNSREMSVTGTGELVETDRAHMVKTDYNAHPTKPRITRVWFSTFGRASAGLEFEKLIREPLETLSKREFIMLMLYQTFRAAHNFV